MDVDLTRVTEATRRYRKAQTALSRARIELQAEVLATLATTRERGAQALLARTTGWTRERIRQLVAEDAIRPGP